MKAVRAIKRNSNVRRCEICSCAAPERRLCGPCLEAIARLAWVWPRLSVTERGMLHCGAMQQESLASAAAASSVR